MRGWLEEFAFSQVADESAVGGEEVVTGQVFERDPAEVVEDTVGDFAVEGADGEELEVDGSSVAIGVADANDVGTDLGADAELLVELAGEGLLRGLAGLYFSAGELPLERHGLVGASLTDKDGVCAQNEGCGHQAHGFATVLLDIRIHVLSV
jgi:hypothetical protein